MSSHLDRTRLSQLTVIRHRKADNGYAIGSHRRQPGKTLGYEEDIHVPLIVRGPGIPLGFQDTASSWSMVDLSKTILQLTGARADYVDDGRVIDLHRQQASVEREVRPTNEGDGLNEHARHAISEYWVLGAEEGVFAGTSLNSSSACRKLM